ncbi:MAG: hypothetical protein QXJ07_05490 [Candidatus Bathyarchaeia archaeon]
MPLNIFRWNEKFLNIQFSTPKFGDGHAKEEEGREEGREERGKEVKLLRLLKSASPIHS